MGRKKKKTGGLHSTLSLNHNKPKISQDINLFPKKMSFLYASQQFVFNNTAFIMQASLCLDSYHEHLLLHETLRV